MDEKVEKMFEKLINNLGFDPSKFMKFNELTDEQEKILKNVTDVIGGNIHGDIKKFGGAFNEEELKKIEDEIKKRMENPIFKPVKKDLEKLYKKWLELKRKEIESYVFAIIPVNELPFPTVSFMTVPRILWESGKAEKMSLNKNGIAYIGEIQALVTRTTLFGKMPKDPPLFAPHIGELDLAGYKPDPSDKPPKSENMRFIYEIINSLERTTTKSQVVRYHDQYERHGEPICDFLMKDQDLIKTLSKLTTAIDSKRQTSNAAIAAIVLPLITTSMVITLDESSGSKKYEQAFEALIKLGAACYETPNVKKGAALAKAEAEAMTRARMQSYTQGQGIGAMVPQAHPAAPQLPVWTEEELAEEAKKRGLPPVNLPVWTEEELAEEAKKRGLGINLPVWTEEELEKEKARRQGAFNIPEWKDEGNMIVCPKCNYSCRPEWSTCPICNEPLPKGDKKAKSDTKEGASVSQKAESQPQNTIPDQQKKSPGSPGKNNSNHPDLNSG